MNANSVVPSFSSIFGETEAGRAHKVKETVEQLLNSVQQTTLDVAELLHEIRTNHYYGQWGFNTFKEYASGLNIKPRKAQYLVRIIEVMKSANIPRTVYEPLGISKLREISTLEPNTNYISPTTNESIPMNHFIVHLVENGNNMDLNEIKENVRVLKGLTGENELVWINFCMKRDARDKVVRPAIELAKMNIGSLGRDDEGNAVDASDGRALEFIAIDYMNDPNNHYDGTQGE